MASLEHQIDRCAKAISLAALNMLGESLGVDMARQFAIAMVGICGGERSSLALAEALKVEKEIDAGSN